jgi:hypothetical protein
MDQEKEIMLTATECWSAMETKYTDLRRVIAKHLLENDLSSIIRTVSSHKRNKVPKGAPQYQSLWHTAASKVQNFCDDYHVDRGEIEAQIPALKELADLAMAPEPKKPMIKFTAGFISGVGLVILLGFLSSAIQWFFTLGWHLAQHMLH